MNNHIVNSSINFNNADPDADLSIQLDNLANMVKSAENAHEGLSPSLIEHINQAVSNMKEHAESQLQQKVPVDKIFSDAIHTTNNIMASLGVHNSNILSSSFASDAQAQFTTPGINLTDSTTPSNQVVFTGGSILMYISGILMQLGSSLEQTLAAFGNNAQATTNQSTTITNWNTALTQLGQIQFPVSYKDSSGNAQSVTNLQDLWSAILDSNGNVQSISSLPAGLQQAAQLATLFVKQAKSADSGSSTWSTDSNLMNNIGSVINGIASANGDTSIADQFTSIEFSSTNPASQIAANITATSNIAKACGSISNQEETTLNAETTNYSNVYMMIKEILTSFSSLSADILR